MLVTVMNDYTDTLTCSASTVSRDMGVQVWQNSMLQVVAPEWLEECLAVGSRVDEQKYRTQLEYCCDSGESWPDLCWPDLC